MLRSFIARSLLASLPLFLATAAFAAGPIQSTDGIPLTPQGTAATCVLEPGPIALPAYVYPLPNYFTAFAWRIPRQACTACGPAGALDIKDILYSLRWPALGCTVHVVVSIVAARGVAPCLEPDTTQVLCGPEPYTLVRTGERYQAYSADFEEGCCIFEDAFVLLRFLDFGSCSDPVSHFTMGISITNQPCIDCDQYVAVSGYYNDQLTEWCSTAGGGSLNSMWMQVQADCCSATPTRRRSWGGVKTIYR